MRRRGKVDGGGTESSKSETTPKGGGGTTLHAKERLGRLQRKEKSSVKKYHWENSKKA